MTETYITKNGTTVIVHIPDRTPEEQAIRDREIEESLRNLYLSMEAEGRAAIIDNKMVILKK
jgi:hypothetical protein